MKLHKLLAFVLVFSLAVIAKNVVVAQDDDSSEPTEMTMEDWQRQMDENTAKKTDLTNQLNSLNTDIDGLKKTSASKDGDVTKAENDLYASVGSTKSGVADFRKSFEEVEKIINSKSGKPEDAMAKFNAIKASKIRCLPEFWDRYNAMEKKMNDWMKPVETKPSGMYTVVKGDCLYKISGKKEIYGNPRLWPALWEANKTVTLATTAPKRTPTTIKNPNLIYPGQMLKVPTLTDKQKSDALSMKGMSKWRKKRTMKKTDSTTTDKTKTTTPTDTKKDTKKTTTPTDTKKDVKKDVKKDEKKTTTPTDTKKDVKKDEKKK